MLTIMDEKPLRPRLEDARERTEEAAAGSPDGMTVFWDETGMRDVADVIMMSTEFDADAAPAGNADKGRRGRKNEESPPKVDLLPVNAPTSAAGEGVKTETEVQAIVTGIQGILGSG